MGTSVLPAEQQRLAALYDAFDRRDVAAVLASLAPDVRWPNGWQGGVVEGRAAVRDYWLRQWAEIDPTVRPTGFERLDDGRVAVQVAQTVRDREGGLIAEGTVVHVYRFRDGLVTDMEIRDTELRSPPDQP